MPAPNADRRRRLADAAIEVVARDGLHGLTHRALDRHAGEPAGTSSNYFRSRDELIVAALDRVAQLHRADMDRQGGPAPRQELDGAGDLDAAAELIATSLVEAATVHRQRYVAAAELQNEIRRRPAIADAVRDLRDRARSHTVAHHAVLDLPIPPEAVPALQALYGGALTALLDLPVERATRPLALTLARTMIFGVERTGR